MSPTPDMVTGPQVIGMRRSCHLTPREMHKLFPGVPGQGVGVGPAALYVALRWHRNLADGKAFPSRSTLAKLLDVSERHVTRYMSVLEDVGLISAYRRQGRPTIYSFHYAGTSDTGVTGTSDKTDMQLVTKPSPTSDTGVPVIGLNRYISGAAVEDLDPYTTEAVIEAGHLLTRWAHRTITPEAIAPLVAGAYPTEIERAASLTAARDIHGVRDPLQMFALKLGDEVSAREAF